MLQGVPIVDEQSAAGETGIIPGMLLELQADSEVIKHSGAGLNAAAIFALERDELGDDIDVAYGLGDRVKVGRFATGDKVNALIASGQDINTGDYLESAGDGTLRAIAEDAATDDDQRVSTIGQAAEDVGPVTALTRLKVWIVG